MFWLEKSPTIGFERDGSIFVTRNHVHVFYFFVLELRVLEYIIIYKLLCFRPLRVALHI